MRGNDPFTPVGDVDPFRFDVVHTRPEHAEQAADVIRLAHGQPTGDPDDGWMNGSDIVAQIERFPEGQFVAITWEGGCERVIGAAVLMRTDHAPDAAALGWKAMIGDYGLRSHAPDGAWLYGVEMSVHPDYRRRGVGSALYRIRFATVERLGLRGLYAAGMLKGYHRYRGSMSPREYGERVLRGEIADPTVTMQLNRGFEGMGVIEDYTYDPPAGHAAMLILRRSGREPRGPARRRAPPGSKTNTVRL